MFEAKRCIISDAHRGLVDAIGATLGGAVFSVDRALTLVQSSIVERPGTPPCP
jgi:hypothetical protein